MATKTAADTYTDEYNRIKADTDEIVKASFYRIDRPVNKGRIMVASASAGLISYIYGSQPRDSLIKVLYMSLAEIVGINIAYATQMPDVVGPASALGYYLMGARSDALDFSGKNQLIYESIGGAGAGEIASYIMPCVSMPSKGKKKSRGIKIHYIYYIMSTVSYKNYLCWPRCIG